MLHCSCLLVSFAVVCSDVPSAEKLMALLLARQDSVHAVRGLVTLTGTPGRERHLLADNQRAQLKEAERLKNHKLVALLEHGLANPPKFVGEVEHGRVLLQYPRVRWEAFGERPPGQQPERMVLWVYQDGIWSKMLPPDPAQKRFNSLFYREDHQPVRVPPLGAILGLGVPNFAGGGTLGLDSVHAKSGQLYWRDWFEHFVRVSETENRQGKLLVRFKSRTCTPGGTPVLLANLFFERGRRTC